MTLAIPPVAPIPHLQREHDRQDELERRHQTHISWWRIHVLPRMQANVEGEK